MNTRSIRAFLSVLVLPLAISTLGARPAYAHCDGLDGPVVEAARVALESGDVRHALAWVLAEGEPEVRRAFDHAVRVRGLGDDARELADRYFFETLVRVHREGEGERYTGLKPAGRDLGPAIPAADRALQSGSVAEVEALLVEQVRHGLRERFHVAEVARDFAPEDVEAGRAYVAAYVHFLHFVESLYEAGLGGSHGHGAPATTAGDAHDVH
jgi:hypothetical protein